MFLKSHDFLSNAQNVMSIWRNLLSDIKQTIWLPHYIKVAFPFKVTCSIINVQRQQQNSSEVQTQCQVAAWDLHSLLGVFRPPNWLSDLRPCNSLSFPVTSHLQCTFMQHSLNYFTRGRYVKPPADFQFHLVHKVTNGAQLDERPTCFALFL